MQLYRLIYYF